MNQKCYVCFRRGLIKLIKVNPKLGKFSEKKIYGCRTCKDKIKDAHRQCGIYNKDLEYDQQLDLNIFLRMRFIDEWKNNKVKKAIINWSGWMLE